MPDEEEEEEESNNKTSSRPEFTYMVSRDTSMINPFLYRFESDRREETDGTRKRSRERQGYYFSRSRGRRIIDILGGMGIFQLGMRDNERKFPWGWRRRTGEAKLLAL